MTEFQQDIFNNGLENSVKRFYGIYRGYIVDNVDPDFIGRMKLNVPIVWGPDGEHDYWAPSKGIFSGGNIGFYALPNIGDMVWVEFEMGDPMYPVWSYGHYAYNVNVPPAGTNRLKPDTVLLQSTSGHRIQLDDADGAENISITDKFGHQIIMNQQGISQVVKDGDKISIGQLNASAEPGVLGNKNKASQDAICDKISVLTVGTAFGPSTVPVNEADFQAIKQNEIAATISNKVTLD